MSEAKSLLAIVATTASLEELLLDSGGEVTPEIEQALEIKEIDQPQKVENYALTIERFEAMSAYYKQRAELLTKMARSCAGVSERCKLNLKTAMTILGTTELLGIDVKYKLSPTTPTVILEENVELDGAYIITETTTFPDKKKITEDLKLGVPVRGARLQENFALRKSANSPDKKAKVVKA